MEKKIINPWEWQNARGYVQAVEIKNPQATLYVSGQTATDETGLSSDRDMQSQLKLAIENLEKVIREAEYELKNIVRLNIYTTSTTELFQHFHILSRWVSTNEMRQTSTVLEVKSLFETLKIELEAIVVK